VLAVAAIASTTGN